MQGMEMTLLFTFERSLLGRKEVKTTDTIVLLLFFLFHETDSARHTRTLDMIIENTLSTFFQTTLFQIIYAELRTKKLIRGGGMADCILIEMVDLRVLSWSFRQQSLTQYHDPMGCLRHIN